MFLLLLILYGINNVLFVYVISFIFKSVGAAQVFTFIFHYFFMCFMPILSFVLRFFESTRKVEFNYLEYIWRAVPCYSFSFAIYNMPFFRIYAAIFAWPDVPEAFEFHGCLWEVIYLSGTAVVLLILLGLIEFQHKFLFWNNMRKIKKQNNNELQEHFLDHSETTHDDEARNQEIQVRDLVKIYSTKKGKNMAVKSISFKLETGHVLGLLGTNGAGKTTTFKILTGDEFPTSGEVLIKGLKMPSQVLNIRKYIGYCPQFDTILERLTPQEHLELYCHLRGIKQEYHKKIIDDLLVRLNLERYKNVESGTLSGGNKRKLTVAISMIGYPSIILLDEPSAGMDP